jgi:hypothetical protein
MVLLVSDPTGRTPPDALEWMPLETFLIFTARVSKMLKPVGLNIKPKNPVLKLDAYNRRKFRGEKLRTILNIEATSPVLDRKVRDASEHFDERLDEWAFQQPRVTAEDLEADALPVSATAGAESRPLPPGSLR